MLNDSEANYVMEMVEWLTENRGKSSAYLMLKHLSGLHVIRDDRIYRDVRAQLVPSPFCSIKETLSFDWDAYNALKGM